MKKINLREHKFWVKKTQLDLFWGNRIVCFVEFPGEMKVDNVVRELFWAKSWEVVEMYDGLKVRCHVKPWHWKEFIKVNKGRFLRHKCLVGGTKKEPNIVFEVRESPNCSSLYHFN